MPARPRNSLLAELEDLADPTPKDFDPEDDLPAGSDEENQSDASEEDDATAARDHYTAVGKSKLRAPEQPSLGPQYTGSRISRDAALAEDDEDDPFAKDFDGESSEEDSEAANSDDDAEELKSADSDSEEEESDQAAPSLQIELPDSSKLQKALAVARPKGSAAATLSQGAEEERAKGKAIQKQRAAFDALLGVRIKLQKAMIGGNTLAGLSQEPSDSQADDLETAFQAAESAAFSLWSSLTSLREQLNTTRTGHKRSHAEFTSDASTSELYQHMQTQDTVSRGPIDTTLERWFSKSHVMENSAGTRSRLNKSANTSAPTAKSVLDSALADRAHLLKRARTPRSCAPYQLSRRKTDIDPSDPSVYDDADMYAVLLTTLLEQKGSGAVVDVGAASGSAHAIRREAKTKRVVDTKASKGRKLRYTVHEKLQNYMAPRDDGVWAERQIDELFSSLFGRRVELGEDDEQEDDGGIEQDEGALLFGR